jgi:hypothetical protein
MQVSNPSYCLWIPFDATLGDFMWKPLALLIALVVYGAALPAQTSRQVLSPAPEFVPDWTFTGSALTGWQPIGDATWQAENGEIIGTPTQPDGGWLVANQSFQDLQWFARVRCDGACTTGVLLRMEKTPAGASGIFVSLRDGDFTTYRMTLDAAGREVSREPITNITWATIRTGVAPGVAAPGGRGSGGAAAGRGGADAPAGRGGAGARGNAGPGDFRGGIKLSTPLAALEPPPYGLGKQPDGWDQFQIIYDSNIVRPYLNNTNQMPPTITGDSSAYGPFALYVGGSAPVRFKDVSFKDLSLRVIPLERLSPRFRIQQLEEFSYAWGTATGDFNKDGNPDVTAGPYIYFGPDFTRRREIYLGSVAGGYPSNMVTHVFDFTGDSWPDVLATESRPMVLYVNPAGENRRWERHAVLPSVGSETTVMADIDGDKRPEIVFASQNTMVFAKYDPTNPTAPWALHKMSEPAHGYGHSSGVGDINGDGRMDILQTAGWWEQPAGGATERLWTYHPVAFGRWGRSQSAGGAEIHVYDVNGDNLNDVVSALHGHGWGLAWFEQKRDDRGAITFERHMIMDNYSTPNAGGVTFSQLHALTVGDVDGDKLPDIITGKRYWSHQDSYFDPDPYGEPVLYWYRLVRNPKAPGGAEFVPELIHNRSGVGSQLLSIDLNRDGVLDLMTATNRGTFLFFGNKR